MAVSFMWDESREWMKLGGKPFLCLMVFEAPALMVAIPPPPTLEYMANKSWHRIEGRDLSDGPLGGGQVGLHH